MILTRRSLAAGAAALAFTPSAHATTPICVAIFGQSLGQQIDTHPGLDILKAEAARSGFALSLVSHCVGGASILKERASPANNYWWDSDSNTNGPVLTAAIAAINAAPVKPVMFALQDGEGDAVSGLPFDQARFVSAYANVVWKLRQACNPANPNAIKTSMQFVTRWTPGPSPNVQKVREAEVAYATRYSTVFGYDTFDLPILGEDPLNGDETNNRHPDVVARATEAWRFWQSCLSMMGNANARMPPLAGTVSFAGATISVPITQAPHGFTKPDKPGCFAVRTGTNVVQSDALDFAWSGDTLVITPPTAPVAGAQLLYPYGELNNLDRARLIVDPHGSPLRTLVRTL